MVLLYNTLELKCVAAPTCRWAGTLPPVPGVSWPWGCCGQSCLHRNKPPPGLWADGPAAAPAADQSSALQHCSRFCLEITCQTNTNVVCDKCDVLDLCCVMCREVLSSFGGFLCQSCSISLCFSFNHLTPTVWNGSSPCNKQTDFCCKIYVLLLVDLFKLQIHLSELWTPWCLKESTKVIAVC